MSDEPVAALWAALRRPLPASVTVRLTHEDDHRAGVLAVDDEIITTLRLPGSVPAPAGTALETRRAQQQTAGAARESVLAVPLISLGNVLGVLAVTPPNRPFAHDDVTIVSEVAGRAAAALANALRFEQEREVAERLQHAMLTELPTGPGVSPGGRLSVATAGHPPPLLREPDGAVRRLEDLGPMLGLPIDYTYTASWTTLRPGSMLLFYTDGLIERRDATIDAGIDPLAAAFEIAPGGVDQIADTVCEVMLRDSSREDDTCLLSAA